ncbi:DUF1972 domain-containing protein [Leeuwenhoekiella sp. UBA6783]|uniref:DUF1972 domain-containing protein n=1 Tax=Leeuwenhoekiella sp. UBA6783 TaxID=1946747 RepID=UPI0025C6C3CF|nr:DUF1972 domain-containing protein [Leeuwenhoekiella sp. UBA6783]|tara:strand:+ start:13483 stop:14583 length:1101 start_codon:yes stop_codon:yes gene_type:complete
MIKKKKVHIVGTHGVPAKYGGFETLADYICQNLGDSYDITVYCNGHKYVDRPISYHGARLKYLNLEANGFKGIFYDFITYCQALLTADIILYLSPVGSGFMTPLKFLFGKKVIVNHGGLNEWEREKLSWIQKKWAKFNHLIASKFSDINIADNILYQDSLRSTFNAKSIIIRYGGDHVNQIERNHVKYSSKYSFTARPYAISVSRAQLDNNLHIALEAFQDYDQYPLVLISNWNISKYGQDLKEHYADNKNLILLDAIYDKEELDYLRGNASLYVHTHSRCGTAPSLVEAMCLSRPVFSFDVPTNRETTENKAYFFKTANDLELLLRKIDENEIQRNGDLMSDIAHKKYTWKIISEQYQELFERLL